MNRILKAFKYGGLLVMCAAIVSLLVVSILESIPFVISYIFPLNIVESEIVTYIVTLILLIFYLGWSMSED